MAPFLSRLFDIIKQDSSHQLEADTFLAVNGNRTMKNSILLVVFLVLVGKTSAFCPTKTAFDVIPKTRKEPLASYNKPFLLPLTISSTAIAKPWAWDLKASLGTPESKLSHQPSWLVKLASSPLGALVALSGVVLFHECGHYVTAKSFGVPVDEFSVGIGPKLWGCQMFGGDTFNLRALPVGGYVATSSAAMQALSLWRRVEILSAGVLFNLLLAFAIYTQQILWGPGLSVPVFDSGILVASVEKGSTAHGLMEPGDIIHSVNGKTLLPEPTSSEMKCHRAISKLIQEVQETREGDSIAFSIRHPPSNQIEHVTLRPRFKQSQNKASVGVALLPNFVGVDLQKSSNVWEAAALSTSHVTTLTKETVIGIGTYANDLLSGRTSTSDYQVSGPVTVLKRATNVVKTQDLDTVLKYVAAASINLGVFNLIPFPPTDGFQILLTTFLTFLQHIM
eukprot:scaffold3759_cov169-Amphora_coffeaeformis.AAC.8